MHKPGAAVTPLHLLVLLILALSQLSYLAGYVLKLGDHTVRWFPRVAGLRWKRERLLLLTVLVTPVSIACYAYFQSRVGVSLFDVTELARGKAVWRDDPTLSWMMRGIPLAFIPLLFFSTDWARRKSVAPVAFAAMAALVVGLLVTRLGVRGPAFHLALAFVALTHYLRRRLPLSMFFLVWFAAVLMMNLLGDVRSFGHTSVSDRSLIDRALSPVQALAEFQGDRQQFVATAVVLEAFPARQAFLLGKTWLGLLVLPIPRWIWPQKQAFDVWYNGIVTNFTGQSIPTPYAAVLYANFYWIGVISGMALLGVLHRGAYTWLRRHPRDQSVVLLYTMFVLFFGLTALGINSFLTYYVPSWLVVRVIGTRSSIRLSTVGPHAAKCPG